MVSKIGGASLAQSLMARVESAKAQESAAVAVTTASSDEAATGTASVRSAQTEASERVGEQLDASRLQGAQGEASAAPAAAGGVHIGGGAASSSESASTDYIAEADTNNDRKVSEQERIAYAKKQASDAIKTSGTLDAPAQQSREQEVQQAYLPQVTTGAQLDIEA